jgi:hypothetical protein
MSVTPEILDATPGGFEPPISTVTGWHVSPLHHGAELTCEARWNGGSRPGRLKSISDDGQCQETDGTYETACIVSGSWFVI